MKPSSTNPVHLVCLPYAGAAETVYFPWRAALPDWIKIVPVPLPGRGKRLSEPLLDNCDRLVDHIYDELHSQLNQPFAFFGHSMGALLAFELTHRLREQTGLTPLALFVSGSVAPGKRQVDPNWLGDDATLLATLQKLNGTSPEIIADQDWRNMLLPILRADFHLCATYRYRHRPPLDCPVYAFAGRSDPATQDKNCFAEWCNETRVGGALHVFDGDHFFIRTRQAELLAFIKRKLATRRMQ